LLAGVASLVIIVLLVLLQLTRLASSSAPHPDRPRRRMFIASVSFLLTFVGCAFWCSIVSNKGPSAGDGARHHIHHSYGNPDSSAGGYAGCSTWTTAHRALHLFSRLMSVSYGVGAALTLDEFALWLNLEPGAYCQARAESIDAVILFGSLLASAHGVHRSSEAFISCGPSAPLSARSLAAALRTDSLARLLRPRKGRRSPPRKSGNRTTLQLHGGRQLARLLGPLLGTTLNRFSVSKFARPPFASRTISP